MKKIDWHEVISEALAAIGFITACAAWLMFDSILIWLGV